MKVKDLINKLKELDQEKNIKLVSANGYEYDEEAVSNCFIHEYKDTQQITLNYKYFPVENYEEDGDDFYLLTSKNLKDY